VRAASRENRLGLAEELGPRLGLAATCRALEVARATLYRRRRPRAPKATTPRPAPPRALGALERQAVLDTLHSPRFVDSAPALVYATLLDEGQYLCSARTMYRVLDAAGQVRERRDQLVHPVYARPELLATGPNQLWSWDITKLRAFSKWTYFYLYVMLDVFSRYVTGWMVAERESDALAATLIETACARQGITRQQLTIHSDRGPSMRSKCVAELLADLGVNKTHSRPHVSNDNPYSESQFKTLKYRPDFPDRFGSMQDARAWCRRFFVWYNDIHRHSGIGWLAPADVHHGRAGGILARRAAVLQAASLRHPERFVKGPARPTPLPAAVWINKPDVELEAENGGYPGSSGSEISRPGACQAPSSSPGAPSPSLLPPIPPHLSLTPSSPKTRAMTSPEVH
jgi:putative transposase